MGQCRSPSVSPNRQAVSSASPAEEELSLFQRYLQEGNPFEMHIEHKEEETEDVLASNGVGAKRRHLQAQMVHKWKIIILTAYYHQITSAVSVQPFKSAHSRECMLFTRPTVTITNKFVKRRRDEVGHNHWGLVKALLQPSNCNHQGRV